MEALIEFLNEILVCVVLPIVHVGHLSPSLPARSKTPSAFTGYSFHLVEAVIVFLNEILVCFVLPVHMGLHRWYHLFTTIIHEGGSLDRPEEANRLDSPAFNQPLCFF